MMTLLMLMTMPVMIFVSLMLRVMITLVMSMLMTVMMLILLMLMITLLIVMLMPAMMLFFLMLMITLLMVITTNVDGCNDVVIVDVDVELRNKSEFSLKCLLFPQAHLEVVGSQWVKQNSLKLFRNRSFMKLFFEVNGFSRIF